MADLAVSSFAALTGANLAVGDLVPVIDISASGALKNSKMTIAELGIGLNLVGGLAKLTTNTFSGLQTLTPSAANQGIIASTGFSLTGSNATNMIDLAGTWNTSGVPNGIKMLITTTAVGGGYALINLGTTSAGSANGFGDGNWFLRCNVSSTTYAAGIDQGGIIFSAVGFNVLPTINGDRAAIIGTGGVSLKAAGVYGWAASTDAGTNDTTLTRQAAAVVQSNGFLRTAAPNGGTAANWKFGTKISTGVSVLDAGGYVELDIGGTLYKLGLVTNS